MISRQRTAGSVSVPGIPGGWYPSVRGSTRSAARGQPRRQRPLPRPGGPRRRGGGAAPPRRAAHSPHPNTTGPHSSTPVHHRIHPRPSLSLSARACGPAAHAGSARAICCSRHTAPPGQLLLRHRVEQHFSARTSHALRTPSGSPTATHPSDLRLPARMRPPPDAQTTTSSHPPRAPPAGPPPPNRLPLATRPDGVPQHTGHRPPDTGARRTSVAGARYRPQRWWSHAAFWMPGMRAVWPPRPLTPRRLPRPVQTQPGQAATVNTPPPFTASVRAY